MNEGGCAGRHIRLLFCLHLSPHPIITPLLHPPSRTDHHATAITLLLLLLLLPACLPAPVQLLFTNSAEESTEAKFVRHPATAWFLRGGAPPPTMRCGAAHCR